MKLNQISKFNLNANLHARESCDTIYTCVFEANHKAVRECIQLLEHGNIHTVWPKINVPLKFDI